MVEVERASRLLLMPLSEHAQSAAHIDPRRIAEPLSLGQPGIAGVYVTIAGACVVGSLTGLRCRRGDMIVEIATRAQPVRANSSADFSMNMHDEHAFMRFSSGFFERFFLGRIVSARNHPLPVARTRNALMAKSKFHDRMLTCVPVAAYSSRAACIVHTC